MYTDHKYKRIRNSGVITNELGREQVFMHVVSCGDSTVLREEIAKHLAGGALLSTIISGNASDDQLQAFEVLLYDIFDYSPAVSAISGKSPGDSQHLLQ